MKGTKSKKAVLLALSAMLVVSCTNTTPLNTTGPGNQTKVSSSLVKSSDKLDTSRLKITTNKAELSRYLKKVTEIQKEKPDSGFRTKAYSLPNLISTPLVALNDPTDLDSHCTDVRPLTVHNGEYNASTGVLGPNAPNSKTAFAAAATANSGVISAQAAVDAAKADLRVKQDAYNALLKLSAANYKGNNRLTYAQALDAALTAFNDAKAALDTAAANLATANAAFDAAKNDIKTGIQSDRTSGTLSAPFGFNYDAATFNVHYVEGAGQQIYSETENGYKQGYVLLIDTSPVFNPEVVAKISMSGAEYTMSYSEGSSLYITGNDPAAPKNGAIRKQAFVMKYDVSDPENPKYMGIRYFEGRNAVSIKAAANGNMIVSTGQAGGLFVIQPDLTDAFAPLLNGAYKDLRDAVYTGSGYMAIDGGYTDQAWDSANEISGQNTAAATTGTASNSPSLISFDAGLIPGPASALTFSAGTDNLGQLGTNLAKASITQIGSTGKYALALSEGGIKIVDSMGTALASAPIPARTANHVSVSPMPGTNPNLWLISVSAGYNGTEKFAFDSSNDSLQNVGSQSYSERVNGGNIRLYGASTNGSEMTAYQYDSFSGYLDRIANGVNGATYAGINLKTPVSGGGVGYFPGHTPLPTPTPVPPPSNPGVFDIDSTATVGEAAGTVSLTITRSGGATGAASVDVTLNNGTATFPSDFDATGFTKTINFADGETTKTFTIPIVNDTINEPDENFTATLSNATGAALGTTNLTSTVTITDDDPPPLSSCTSYTYLAKWGSQGTGDGQFQYPLAISVYGTDYIFVDDTNNNRIQKFGPDGTFITQWGSLGSGDGQFNGSWGFTVDGAGNVYVADTNNNRIQKFGPDGTFITKWGSYGNGDGQLYGPSGVSVDGAGNVYVADSGNNRIQKFSSTGTYISQWGTEGFGDGQFQYPVGISMDGAGNIFTDDYYNNRIQKFGPDGTFITKWGTQGSGDGQLNNPREISIDSAGNVYIADSFNHRIQKFTSTGTYITQFGSAGSGDGQFIFPWGVSVDGAGNVYVADTYNQRIQKFGCITP